MARLRGAGGHVGDERPVDLQDVHRQAPQVGERRVPGAEVVDGEARPRRRDPPERRHRRLGVGHDRRLGQLELHERPGRRPPPARSPRALRAGPVEEVPHREVDRHREPRQLRGSSARAARARSSPPSRSAGCITSVASANGTNRPEARSPSRGCRHLTSASNPSMKPYCSATFGWKWRTSSPSRIALPQLGEDGEPLGRVLVQLARVGGHAPGRPLRAVERHVRAAEQLVAVAPLLREEGDAGARPDLEPHPGHPQRLARGPRGCGAPRPPTSARLSAPGTTHRELVAPEPEDVARAGLRTAPRAAPPPGRGARLPRCARACR